MVAMREMLGIVRFIFCYSGCGSWFSEVQCCIILKSRTGLVILKSNTVEQVGIGGSEGDFSPGQS